MSLQPGSGLEAMLLGFLDVAIPASLILAGVLAGVLVERAWCIARTRYQRRVRRQRFAELVAINDEFERSRATTWERVHGFMEGAR